MKRLNFNEYYASDKYGTSNCVIRSFCKLFDADYDKVYEELCNIAKELNCNSYNDIEVALTNIGEIAARDIAREEKLEKCRNMKFDYDD